MTSAADRAIERIDLRVAPDTNRAAAWDNTWPVKGAEIVRLIVAFVAVAGTGVVIGLVSTDWAAPNAVTRLDARVADGFADNRIELAAGATSKRGPVAGPSRDYHIKQLRDAEKELVEHAERAYEVAVAHWQPQKPSANG